MSERQSQPRRERILDAAEVEFSAHGYAGARMNRIASVAGVNKQLLFHYFGSKAGLHRAAVASAASRFAIDPPAGSGPADRIRKLMSRLAGVARQRPSLLGPAAQAEAGAVVRDWLSRAVQVASQILEDGQRSGHVRDDINVEAVAELVVTGSLGLALAGNGEQGAADHSGDAQPLDMLAHVITDYCAWR